MFNDVKDAIKYIESKRIKRSFQEFKQILENYNINTNQENIIHIAGTNGKGSTTTFIRNILIEHGYRVGTFISPYIINHNERIAINGVSISDEDLLRIINKYYSMIEKENLSMFEIDVIIMLDYFNDSDLDYRVIECGIGGMYDKTNVVNSIRSVITNIGFDHQFMLGDTLLEIAKHKAGIIKSPLYTTEKDNQILESFEDKCKQQNVEIKVIKVNDIQNPPYIITFENHQYQLNNCGHYQIYNASLALNVCASLIKIDKHKVQKVFDNFSFPGRFEKFGNIYIDGAHNIDGIKVLLKTIQDYQLRDVGIVFSSLGDKDYTQMLELLNEYDVIKASFEDERYVGNDIHFIDAIEKMKQKHKYIIVTGSLHFISTVRNYLKQKE